MSQNRLHDYEQEMNRKLEGHELDVPDHLWAAIEKERYPSQRRRMWPVFLFLLLGVGMAGVGVWHFSDTESDGNSIASELPGSQTSLSVLDQRTDLSTQNRNESDLEMSSCSDIAQAAAAERRLKEEKNTFGFSGNKASRKENFRQQELSNEENLSISQDGIQEKANIDKSRRTAIGKTRDIGLVLPLSFQEALVDEEDKSLDCPIFSDRGTMTNISLEFGFGPALSFHQITAEPGYEDFLSARLLREQPLVNYGAHVKLKKEWANNTTASVGFNLTTFNYQYKRVDSNEVRRTVITIDTFYQGHDYTTTVDTLLLIEQGLQEHKSGMTHRVLSFPVSFGYKMEVNRLFLEPYLGATFNIFQRAEWSQDMFSDLIEGPVNEVMDYRTNLGVMAHVGMTLGWELNSRWSLILQPEYHHSWNSITSQDMPVTENRNWVNINAGIKYKLWQTKKLR